MYTLALSHAWLQLQHCMQLIHLYLKWVVQCPSDSGYLQFLWTNGNVRVSSGDSLCGACKKLVFFSFSSTITAKDRNPKMSDPNNVSLTGSIEQLPQGSCDKREKGSFSNSLDPRNPAWPWWSPSLVCTQITWFTVFTYIHQPRVT